MEDCESVSISKRHINCQDRWMLEATEKDGCITANEITFCPYCGIELNHRNEPENKPLTIDKLEKLAEYGTTVYGVDRKPYDIQWCSQKLLAISSEKTTQITTSKIAHGFFLYARKPKGSNTK
jgi:hypothetical protein